MLANLLRTDGDRHRPLPNDSHDVEAIAVLARAHRDAIRTGQRDANRLRSLLREFFPAAVTAFPRLSTRSALTILAAAPTPAMARGLSSDQIRQLLRAAGRVGVRTSEVERLHQAFTAEQLHQPPAVEQAMGEAVRAIVTTLTATQTAIADLETALAARFDNHPDAEILRSLPGLGVVLGGRVLGEFGDDPTRFSDAASRRRYAGTAPVTRASGKSRVVLLRRARNQRLAEACRWWAFNAMQHSPGTMAYYRRRRAAGDTHEAALRRLGSKLVGQLHHCLEHREPYREDIAWPNAAIDQPSQTPADRGLSHHPDSRQPTGHSGGVKSCRQADAPASRSALDTAAETRMITGAGRWRPATRSATDSGNPMCDRACSSCSCVLI